MLYIIATPIGNLDDISIRAISTLFTVEILLCEDTRRTGTLLQELRKRFSPFIAAENNPKLVSFYEEIEAKKLPEIIDWLTQGKNIGLVSDNGMPGISDPGFTVVREARKRQLDLTVIPGPSAAITALVGSGMPTNSFTFLGFFPEKEGPQRVILTQAKEAAKNISTTYMIYCAPHKLLQTLGLMKDILGDIHLVIARELTKIHEEYWQGTISEAQEFYVSPMGEMVVLFRL